MAATGAQSTQSGAKAPKKKAASKTVDRTASPAPSASHATEKGAANGQQESGSQENAYIREVQKNIRNVNKKIFNASKTDAILSEHAGKSLDELVASRILNADQKAQILKKPALQTQLAQLEEQLAQLKKFDADFQTRIAVEKEALEKNLVEKLGKEKADAVQEVTDKAEADVKRTLHDSFLIVSQFLRLAAARRAEEADPMLDENQALEGVLLAVYGGDENAVNAMLKLVEGTDDKTLSTSGEQLETTFANIKSVAQAYLTPLDAVEEAEAKPAEAEIGTGSEATATEDAAAPVEQVSGESPVHVNGATPAAEAPVTEEVASATNDASLSASQEWVSVSRPDEAGSAPAPAAAPSATQSWADDQPEAAAEAPATAPTDSNDGFHQVQRNRGREREGGNNWRGGRGRGEGRGRGGRGDGRGRRGGGRGGAGTGHRGARKTEES